MGLALDASAAVDLLMRSPRGIVVRQHLAGEDVVAPELLDVEVASALARLVRSGSLPVRHADPALRLFAGLPVQRVPHAPLLRRAWELRDRIRVADALYVACADGFGVSLLTCDARLAAAAPPGTSVLLVR